MGPHRMDESSRVTREGPEGGLGVRRGMKGGEGHLCRSLRPELGGGPAVRALLGVSTSPRGPWMPEACKELIAGLMGWQTLTQGCKSLVF